MESTERIIELPLKNQNYDITQEFIDELFKNFEAYHIIETAFLSMNEDNMGSVKLIMTVVDDFLDQISKSENGLMKFDNIELIQKYSEGLTLRNITMIYKYLDNYSKKFNCKDSFFWLSLQTYVSDDVLINSFYFYLIITDYISKIANISKTKEEYIDCILQILKDIYTKTKEIKNINEIDNIVYNYLTNN